MRATTDQLPKNPSSQEQQDTQLRPLSVLLNHVANGEEAKAREELCLNPNLLFAQNTNASRGPIMTNRNLRLWPCCDDRLLIMTYQNYLDFGLHLPGVSGSSEEDDLYGGAPSNGLDL